MKRSLAGLFIVLFASNLASALGAPADILQHDPLAPASLPDLLAIPPSTSDLFAPGALTDGAVGEPLLPGELDDSAVPVTHATTPHATKLGAPPAGLFLMIQGIVCIAFFRGRRKWAALLVAALAASRSGIGSLPRLLSGAKHAKALPCEGRRAAGVHEAQGGATQTPAIDYIGLLRRLGTEGEAGAGATGVSEFVWAPVARSAAAVVATFLPPFSCDLSPALFLDEGQSFVCAIQPSESLLLPDTFHPSMFARPPPLAA